MTRHDRAVFGQSWPSLSVQLLSGLSSESIFGVAPIFHGSALVFGVFSYCGRIEVSFGSCRRVVPDPAFLAKCVQASYDELLAKLQAPHTIPHRRRARA